MKITKFGHCCLLIEIEGVRILTDPAAFSTGHESVKNIDIILITHEHFDHFHIDSLKIILQNNLNAKVITNSSVAKLMQGMQVMIVSESQSVTEKGILVEGFGTRHRAIYGDYPPTENTGYFIAEKLFYPGDAFTDPKKAINILALPSAGPWMKLSEAIDYAKKLKPEICFPVHDGITLIADRVNLQLAQFLEPEGIKLKVLELGQETEI